MLRPDRYPFFDKLLFGVFVVLLPAFIASAKNVFGDGDVSWHIAAGRWILAHGRVPATDPFSFTLGGHPWVAFEWLSEVIYAAAFNLAGYPGVATLTKALDASPQWRRFYADRVGVIHVRRAEGAAGRRAAPIEERQ